MADQQQPPAHEGDQVPPASVKGHDARAYLRHELRTPLNQIIGYSEMLLEEMADGSDTALCPALTEVHAASRQLLETITRVLSQAELASDLSMDDLRSPIELVIDRSERLIEGARERRQESWEQDLLRIVAAARQLYAVIDLVRSGSLMPEKPVAVASGPAIVLQGQAAATRPETQGGLVLVVDDNDSNRDMLSRRLRREGHFVAAAETGVRALEILREFSFDVVLLDTLMPDMDGFEVLRHLKGDPQLRHLPVIMLSAQDDVESVVHCIEVGADDYLPKPFNFVLLRARIGACLERKRLRDQEQTLYGRLREEQEKSERLLLNVLPQAIAERLKLGETTIADSFSDVTVLFADLVGFTRISADIAAVELVQVLQEVFSAFDGLGTRHGLEKIKTIGDNYMVVGGLPTPRPDHVEAVAEMALELLEVLPRLGSTARHALEVRVGIHTGPVVAGIIGSRKFSYDLWGDTVNIASRMESQGRPGRIQISADTYARLGNRYRTEERGIIDVKGRGGMVTHFLVGR